MTPFARFRYWIAEPLLARLRVELGQVTVDRQREAYQLGVSHGEYRGQQMLLADLGRIMDERRAQSSEVTEADIERARKGMVH